MKSNELLDAIGGIDPRMIEAADIRPLGKPKRIKTRTAILAACIALMVIGSAVAVAVLLSSGRLSFSQANPRSDKRTDVDFIIEEDIRIPVKDIRGAVSEAGPILAEQMANRDPLSSLLPEYRKTFDSVAQASEFIGYDLLRIPAIRREPDSVEVSASADAEGRLTGVQVLLTYSEGTITAWSVCNLYTEYCDSPVAITTTSYSDDFEGVDYTGSTLSKYGREFHVVKSTPFEDNWLNEMVFWQENKVVFHLDLRYQPADQAAADRIADEWMASFSADSH